MESDKGENFYPDSDPEDVQREDNGEWSDSSNDEIIGIKKNRNQRSSNEENEVLKTTLANSITSLQTIQSQLEGSVKLSKKLKSKKTMLDFEFIKATSFELHRELIESVLTIEDSVKMAKKMLQQVSSSSNPLLFGYSKGDSLDKESVEMLHTPVPHHDQDSKKFAEIIRRLKIQNINLENRNEQMNEQYQIAKEQIRELHLMLRHTDKTSRDGALNNLEARDGDTRRFNEQISESNSQVFILKSTIEQLHVDIKDQLSDFRNKEKHYKREIKKMKTQYEDDKTDILRGCKAELDNAYALKHKEISEAHDEHEQLKVSMERIHHKQISDLRRESLIQTKKLNKKLSDLKIEIEIQRKAAKVDAIRMQETIQAAKLSMVRKTFGESSDEDSDGSESEEDDETSFSQSISQNISQNPSGYLTNEIASTISLNIEDDDEDSESSQTM